MKRTYLYNICPNCGKSFIPPSPKTKHCSVRCFNQTNQRWRNHPGFTQTCEQCGKQYTRVNGQTKRRFCSRHCAIIAKHGTVQLTLKVFPPGQKRIIKQGHSRKTAAAFKESFPFCQRCGWREEPKILHVHHKDRDRKNRTIENFEVLCPTCHVLEHFRAGDSIWRRSPS